MPTTSSCGRFRHIFKIVNSIEEWFLSLAKNEYHRQRTQLTSSELNDRIYLSMREVDEALSECGNLKKRDKLWFLKSFFKCSTDGINYLEILTLVYMINKDSICPCEFKMFSDFITCENYKKDYYSYGHNSKHYCKSEDYISVATLARTILNKLTVNDFVFCEKMNIDIVTILTEYCTLDMNEVVLNENYIQSKYISHSLPTYFLQCIIKFKFFVHDFFFPKLHFELHDEDANNNKTDDLINIFNTVNGHNELLDRLVQRSMSSRLTAEEYSTMKIVLKVYPSIFADHKITLKQLNSMIFHNPKVFSKINRYGCNDRKCLNIFKLYKNLNFTRNALCGLWKFFKFTSMSSIIDLEELLGSLILWFSSEKNSRDVETLEKFGSLVTFFIQISPSCIIMYCDSLKILFTSFAHVKSCQHVLFLLHNIKQ